MSWMSDSFSLWETENWASGPTSEPERERLLGLDVDLERPIRVELDRKWTEKASLRIELASATESVHQPTLPPPPIFHCTQKTMDVKRTWQFECQTFMYLIEDLKTTGTSCIKRKAATNIKFTMNFSAMPFHTQQTSKVCKGFPFANDCQGSSS